MIKNTARLLALQLKADIRTPVRSVLPVCFFVLCVLLLAMTAQRPAPVQATGLLWSTVLLAGVLGLPAIFNVPAQNGLVDIWHRSIIAPELCFFVRMFSHWLTTGVPLLVALPAGFVLFDLPFDLALRLWAGLFFATLCFGFYAGLCSALATRAKNGGILGPFVYLCLTTPLSVAGTLASTHTPAIMVPAFALLAFAAVVLCPVLAARLFKPDLPQPLSDET